MKFGKNRVQYEERFWSYLHFKGYDVYYYKEGYSLAAYTAQYAEKAIEEISGKLDYNPQSRIQFIVFNKYSDLKQSNIGLMEDVLYNTGGITNISGTKVFLYFDGNHKKLEEQIRYGVANILLNELLFGQNYFSQIKNTTLMSFPAWYLEGLEAYLARGWDDDINNKVKDGILSGRYRKFNRLEGKDAINAGHSIWKYIDTKFGGATIPNIVYMSKINKNVENGFLFVIGTSFKTLISDWYDYYYNYRYLPESKTTSRPAKDFILRKLKRARYYSQLKLSPDGMFAAYTTNELGQYKVWLYDTEKKKSRWIMKRENRLDEKADYSFPLVSWHPTGRVLSIFVEAKGKTWLYFYSMDNHKLEKRPVYHFEKVLDFSYNDRGDRFVVSAVRKGHSDIYIYNIASNTFEPVTNDIYDDLNPEFINNSKDIIFSSNRSNDTIKQETREELDNPDMIRENMDIFVYHYSKKSGVLQRVTDTRESDEMQPVPYDSRHIAYLSNANGIYNRYIARFDSAVSFIDTIIHYRHFVVSAPVTNELFNIIEQNSTQKAGKFTEIIYNDAVNKMYIREIPKLQIADYKLKLNDYSSEKSKRLDAAKGKIQKAAFQNQRPNDSSYIYIQQKSGHKGFVQVTSETSKQKKDSTKIDINNYKLNYPVSGKEKSKNKTLKSERDSEMGEPESLAADIPRARNANVEYNITQLVSQLDFSYLNTSYQPFSGGGSPIYINPGFNAFIQVGAADLFEDYRITGGVRLSLNLTNNEYFVSFNNLKKRLDRELILHRISFEDATDYYVIREHTNEALYILKYPINRVLSLKITGTLKNDRFVYMSTDRINLQKPVLDNIWTGLKGEIVFDNTRDAGLNLYYGTRYKLFGEYFRQVNSKGKDLLVVGFDYRHYTRISRTFIWANRFAVSTSIGRNKLIYYLGGVDTWLKPSFNREINIAKDQNYVYQTLATPMRGFEQNIRNGNSFAVFNSELRFPVFKYFIKKPIKSDFLSNFQVIGFSDVGTAWTGPSPYSDKNSLYTQVIQRGPIIVTLKNQKEPVVEGFGFGLRTRLFGYFIRGDWAWGIEDREVQKMKFYLSLSLDF